MSKLTLKTTSDIEVQNNLRAWFDASKPHNVTDGMNWYTKAQEFTASLAKEFAISQYKTASVISALSPNNKWERNKFDARQVLMSHKLGWTADQIKVCTYNQNKIKAFGILLGTHQINPDSPKTHAFAMNVGLGSRDHLTVDKWHIRASLLTPEMGILSTVESVTIKQYRRLEALTLELAREQGLAGHQYQAIIWLTIKEHWDR